MPEIPISMPTCEICKGSYPMITECVKCSKIACNYCLTKSMKYGGICKNCFPLLTKNQQDLMTKENEKIRKLRQLMIGAIILGVAIPGIIAFLFSGGYIPLTGSEGEVIVRFGALLSVGVASLIVFLCLAKKLASKTAAWCPRNPESLPDI